MTMSPRSSLPRSTSLVPGASRNAAHRPVAHGGARPGAATKKRQRRTSLPQSLAPGRLARGLALLGLAGLTAYGVVRLARAVEGTNRIPLASVVVTGLAPAHVDAASDTDATTEHAAPDAARVTEILAYADVHAGEPYFGVDLDAVARRVREHPFVASVDVRRVLPDGIEIRVEERAAAAAVRVADGLYLVDDTGALMKRAEPGDGLDLPIITLQEGEAPTMASLAPCLSLLAEHVHRGMPGGPISEIVVLPRVGIELVLDDGARVRVGKDQFETKIARLQGVVAQLAGAGRAASFIYLDDATRPERVAVRLRPVTETKPVGG